MGNLKASSRQENDDDEGEAEDDNYGNVSEETLNEHTFEQLATSESRSESPEPPLPLTFTPSRQVRKKLKTSNPSQEVDQLMEKYLESRIVQPSMSSSKPPKEDEIEKFLLSMAPTLRKMPERVLADVKFQIHQVIHQAEMEIMHPPASPTQNPQISYMPMPAHNNWPAPHSPGTSNFSAPHSPATNTLHTPIPATVCGNMMGDQYLQTSS